jgi:1,4-dihydroxy-2-naphthoyl-CoA hydrolase
MEKLKKSIWFNNPTVSDIEWMFKNTLADSLHIRVTDVGDDYIKGTMPVDARTKQPYGILHGGASVSLAETLGSIASGLIVDTENFIAVGIEINANHLAAVSAGTITGICKPIRCKGSIHVWEIKMTDDSGELICISRFTCKVISKSKLKQGISKNS